MSKANELLEAAIKKVEAKTGQVCRPLRRILMQRVTAQITEECIARGKAQRPTQEMLNRVVDL